MKWQIAIELGGLVLIGSTLAYVFMGGFCPQ